MGVTMDQRRRLMMASKCLDIRLGRLARVDLDPDVAVAGNATIPAIGPLDGDTGSMIVRHPSSEVGSRTIGSTERAKRRQALVESSKCSQRVNDVPNSQWSMAAKSNAGHARLRGNRHRRL